MSQEPVERGGWSALMSTSSGFNFADPGSHPLLRGNGTGPSAFPGWPTIPQSEKLRSDWFEASDQASRREICAEIQRVVLDEVAFVPLGAFTPMTAVRRDLVGRIGGLPAFWGIRRT